MIANVNGIGSLQSNTTIKSDQTSKKFSLGTKILFSFVLLIFVSASVLDISTIMLLREDKRKFTLQSQSTEAFLVGKNFVSSLQESIGSLKLALSLTNPTNAIGNQEMNSLKSLVENQTNLLGLIIKTQKSADKTSLPYFEYFKKVNVDQEPFDKDYLIASTNLFQDNINDIIKEGFSILNISKLGFPVLAIAVTDVDPSKTTDIIPYAIGFFPMKSLTNQSKVSRLTVTTKNGNILYDSDSAFLIGDKALSENDPFFKFANDSKVINGTSEYLDSLTNEKFLGSFYRPGLNLIVLTKTPIVKAMKATYLLTEKFILLALITISAAIIFAIIFAKSLSYPIIQLYEATKEISKGNFNLNLSNSSRDEIGELSNSFSRMSKEIANLIQEKLKKAQMENELLLASTVQQTLIPPTTIETDHVHIESFYQSATECGGDLWGFFEIGDKACFMIADATGHGLPSTLITASARSCFSMIQKLAEENHDLFQSAQKMLSYANRVVFDASNGKIMMTLFLGIIDYKKGTLTYANAAHNPPLLFQKNESTYNLKSLVLPGTRLGESKDLQDSSEQTINLNPEDVLFLYTDGLPEGLGTNGSEYGKKRMRKFIESKLTQGIQKTLKYLVSDFKYHNGNKPLNDDVTLVMLKIKNIRDQVGDV